METLTLTRPLVSVSSVRGPPWRRRHTRVLQNHADGRNPSLFTHLVFVVFLLLHLRPRSFAFLISYLFLFLLFTIPIWPRTCPAYPDPGRLSSVPSHPENAAPARPVCVCRAASVRSLIGLKNNRGTTTLCLLVDYTFDPPLRPEMAPTEPLLPGDLAPDHSHRSEHHHHQPAYAHASSSRRRSHSVTAAMLSSTEPDAPLSRATSSAMTTDSRATTGGSSIRERLGLGGVARRTLGIILLLAVVFLWTLSNFLASVSLLPAAPAALLYRISGRWEAD